MAEASGSSTPPRSRTATAGSSESHPTPSRISRLFSFGSASAAGSSSSRAAEESAARTNTTAAHEASSASSSAGASDADTDKDATLSGHHDGRPWTPTPPARRNSKAATLANGALTAPQRRNSKPSFLSSILQSSSGPSEPQSNNGKGEDTLTPKRPGVLARPSTDAPNTSWRLPWTSPKKKTLQFPANSAPPQYAHSFGSAMNGDVEGTDDNALVTVESNNTSTSDVVDEGISMSDTSGKVDFLTSLPLELSLYVLLFAEMQTISRAMQVSPTWHTIASDALIWRDYFYRNPGWEIRPDILESGYMNGTGPEDTLREEGTPSKKQAPSQPRSRRSTTVTSDGSIAARIGRRISNIVSDISFLTLQTDRNNAEAHLEEEDAPSLAAQPEDVPAAGPSVERERSLSHSVSRDATPSRTRSSTATSTAATHPSSFYTPLRSSMRQRSGPGRPPSRRGSQSFSIVQSLLETHGSPNLQGIPLGPQILRENDHTHPHFALQNYSTNGTTTPPPAASQRPESSMKNRRKNSGTFSPYQSLVSPMKEFEPNASLFLDWRGLYKDRLELERRWQDVRFKDTTLKGHKDSVYCIALKEDMLISGSRDRSIKVWNTKTGKAKRTIVAHTASVLAIQYDGKMMVTGASNGELFVWDVETWEVTDILEGHQMGVLDVQMNDKWIVSCSKDTSIRVWKRDTKEAYRVLQGHRGPVNAIQLHGDKICSASGDSLAKLWNIESGQIVRVFKGHERGLACVQYDGHLLATGSNDKTIRIWDPNTGECTKVLEGHKDLVRTLSYDPIRRRLYSGSYDKTTRLWDIDSGEVMTTLEQSHKSLVFDVTMDVSRLVSCSHDQMIVITDFGEDLNAHRFI